MAKYQAYAEYKDSGVQWIGNIPKDWKFLRGKWKFKSLKEVNRDLQCMDRLALTMNGVIERSIDSDEGLQPAEFSGYQIFEKDDLVFKLIDLENFKTSRVGLVFKRGIMSPAYIRLKPFVGTDSKFFYYFYFDLYLRGVYNQIGGQGVRSALNATDLLEIEVCIPSLSEQKLIANFLDHETTKIDHLIEKQQQLIELLKEKRQAVISHAVTKGLDPNVLMKDSGVEWLGNVPEHWIVCRLKHVANIQSGIAKGKDIAGKATISVPMLRVANVQDGYLNLNEVHHIEIEKDQLERYLLKDGDVLMNEGGDNDKLGRGAVWKSQIKDCIHQNHVFAIRPYKIEPEWLDILTRASYAKFHFFRQSKQSTNLASISSTNIKETTVLVPPKTEREAILRYLKTQFSHFDALENQCILQVNLLKERRTALISAAVTGKIDVRNWQAPSIAEAHTELSA
ncbi:hypothetical protein D9K79_17240 [Acinetobacter cumulans]|uniref:Type I restriction modification DNA specificity domain-containing protein n=1 Tax=Acinetobacter cumulans TaxID=2136182 RepID=A0ABX9U2H1_9GAMM|nr:restriction endonuclease subunit S [Acinetobacter cumulans]RLL37252.1 hypothetical protein D9K79_17240 [Acinetobacter cumulans]